MRDILVDVKKVFNIDKEFDRFLFSCICAQSDLTIVNDMLLEIKFGHKNFMYLFKQNVGHLREALKFLDCFNDHYHKTLANEVEGYEENIKKLSSKIGGLKFNNGDTYIEQVLKPSRDSFVFHYNTKEKHFMAYKEVFSQIKDEDRFHIYLGDNKRETRDNFIEMLQFSGIITKAENYLKLESKDQEENLCSILTHMNEIIALTLTILDKIKFTYLSKRL